MILVNYFSLYIKEKDFKNLRRKKKTHLGKQVCFNVWLFTRVSQNTLIFHFEWMQKNHKTPGGLLAEPLVKHTVTQVSCSHLTPLGIILFCPEKTDSSFPWSKKASLIPGPLQTHAIINILVINKLKYFNKTRYSQLHKISLHWFKKQNKPLDCIWGAYKLISVISQWQFFLNCLKKQNYLRQD